MTLWQATILALVQAVTEFLPVSSSGHLILLPRLLGWSDQGLAFDVATNTGTLLAVVAYYFRDLKALALGALRGTPAALGEPDPRRFVLQLAVATFPAALCGLLFHDVIATVARNPLLIAANAALFGLLLGAADRFGGRERTISDLTWIQVMAIGAAQALALNPGTSRSGITITAALFLGLARPEAARFSFLLSVPIGVLAAGHELLKTVRGGSGEVAVGLAPTIVGVVVSAVAGYAVIGWLLGWLRRRSLTVFVAYRWLLALTIVLLFWK